jgi:hypothetical protein
MAKFKAHRRTKQRRRINREIPLGFTVVLFLIVVTVLAGCGDDDSGEGANTNSGAFCDAIERSKNANIFGVAASGDREPDLGLYLAGLEGMSAAYKDALANVPSEIKDEFDPFASEATQRYDEALAIEDPTDQTVDAVIFGGPDPGGPSEELVAYINTECGVDF